MSKSIFQLHSTYSKLPQVFFTKLSPSPVSDPKLLLFNENLAEEIGLEFAGIRREEYTELLSGNLVLEGIEPLAQAYAGHQFGNLTMLGDGRAIVLGEYISKNGDSLDIQLKGSGKTPYSRGGDGRAALGPMLREYIISEAMHSLGIPTTRSLAVVTTGETVYRDKELPGAILTRIAASHIRVGTFEFAALQGNKTITRALLDYLINRHFPEIREEENTPLALLNAVIQQQAELIVHWMRVGFIHGVMNTDNMALSGETIDYGPCAFMDRFAPDTVFSSIDHRGRYAYANQPHIAQWNLARLAEALLPLIDKNKKLAIEKSEDALNSFQVFYKEKWKSMMRSKIGLCQEYLGDEQMITDLLDYMHQNQLDYTNTFCDLARDELPESDIYKTGYFKKWHARWKDRQKKEKKSLKSSRALMKSVNPAVIPRNHKVEEALQAAQKHNLYPFNDLMKALEEPYKDDHFLAPYQTPPSASEKVHQTFCGT